MMRWFKIAGLLLLVLVGCQTAPQPPTIPLIQVKGNLDDFAPLDDFSAVESVALQSLEYFDLINKAAPLSEGALERLQAQGFVIDETYRWNRFVDAYAWIYWQDLPVLITTDSILHTIHQSYDSLLEQLEMQVMLPKLTRLLDLAIARAEQAAAVNTNGELDASFADTLSYLRVAKALSTEQPNGLSGSERKLYEWAMAADTHREIELLGTKRPFDFTLFQPRGHYYDTLELQRYFRTMAWLGQLDFRFIHFDRTSSEPQLNKQAMASAIILQQVMDGEAHALWQEMDALFAFLVGRSDNMLLPDLARFMNDANLPTADAVFSVDDTVLLDLLVNNDYGQQRITGNIIERHTANDSSVPIPRPVSFLLFGQRFAIDSYVMGNLVYDRMVVDGRPIERPLSSPLDAMFALGNDRALTHLEDELAQYDYGDFLAGQRQVVDALEADIWNSSIYNRWLTLLRMLDIPTTDPIFPDTMRTAAWADKMLHTQLASWAQLRRDNILYVKQPFVTAQIACSFPDGYVEPYPSFFAALSAYADEGQQLMQQTDFGQLELQEQATGYFERLGYVATMLQMMAERQLRGEPLTAEEDAFLQSMIIHQLEENPAPGCGGPRFIDTWDGWYRDLFFSDSPELFDENPAVIADVITNPTTDPSSALYPPRVLHAATGHVVPIYFVVERDGVPTLFVGASFTYYELTTEGERAEAPKRYNDDEWRRELANGSQPEPPAWTETFRLLNAQPQLLELPSEPYGE